MFIGLYICFYKISSHILKYNDDVLKYIVYSNAMVYVGVVKYNKNQTHACL